MMERAFLPAFSVILIFLFANPVSVFCNSLVQDTFDLSLSYSATTPSDQAIFLSQDTIDIQVNISNKGTIAASNIQLKLSLPEGLTLLNSDWSVTEQEGIFNVPTPISAKDSALYSLKLLIEPTFIGGQLKAILEINQASNDKEIDDIDSKPGNGFIQSLSNPSTSKEDDTALLIFEAAQILESVLDTCTSILDSTTYFMGFYTLSNQQITYRIGTPITLFEQTAQKLKKCKCAPLKLKKKKKKKKKEKCSCLNISLEGPTADNYSDWSAPDKKQKIYCYQIPSASRIGDTIIIDISTIDGGPIKKLVLTDQNGELLAAEIDNPIFQYSHILTTNKGGLNLFIQAKGPFWKKRFATVTITRHPKEVVVTKTPDKERNVELDVQILAQNEVKVSADTTLSMVTQLIREEDTTKIERINSYLSADGDLYFRDTVLLSKDTCQGAFSMASTTLGRDFYRVVVDTLMYEVSNKQFSVVGSRNPFGLRSYLLEVKIPTSLKLQDLPLKDTLFAVAYWIGIGYPAITAYETLSTEVPPEWVQPGISLPIGAYGLQHPVVLPGLNPADSIYQKKFVRYAIANNRNANLITEGENGVPLFDRNTSRPNYGILPKSTLLELVKTAKLDPESGKTVFKMYLGFFNNHEINTYPVSVQIISYYKVTNLEFQWIKVP